MTLPAKKSRAAFPEITLRLPRWVSEFLKLRGMTHHAVSDRMGLVIELSRLNVENGTGGPFAAAVFDRRTNTLLAPGINMVTCARCSVAHAEVMAILTAQKMLGRHDLGWEGPPGYEIVSSTEPCAMCQGAIAWSGLRSLVCGATGGDACRIGFDEGPKSRNWVKQFRSRGISVTRNVCRKEAVAVLQSYKRRGGVVYNGRQPAI
jgi:tRNA(Arg) A34 adenosine deaminase TadA